MRILGLFLGLVFISLSVNSQTRIFYFDVDSTEQIIHSFGASDCWRTQFIGENWPKKKREKIADLLFSNKYDNQGNPKGIGLSLWRFNIGSGSHEAADKSGINSEWRRTECFLDKYGGWNWNKQKGQKWMLKAARKRGVKYTLGFSISAPYFMTKNGLARASEKTKYANIKDDSYDDYASFMTTVARKLKLDYLSPINEPQWEWIGSGQEGMQATNYECSKLIHLIDKHIQKNKIKTKIVFGEAADIRYLYRAYTDKPDRDKQIVQIFSKDGKYSINGLKSIAHIVSGHSYWSTWPVDTLVNSRKELKEIIQNELSEKNAPANHFDYWQTEYCPMEKNKDNINGGNGRDLSISTALYVARVIHSDLTIANATSWQWWTALSEWNYKDGLIFIDDGNLKEGASTGNESMIETCKYDGEYSASKTLWALGNYSFFIRPGMIRLKSENNTKEILSGIMASGYIDKSNKKIIIVVINNNKKGEKIKLNVSFNGEQNNKLLFRSYLTSSTSNLKYIGINSNVILIPPMSIMTFVSMY